MVICPSCREDNEEGAAVCSRCGSSLEPGVATRMPVRRTDSDRPPLEIRAPKPPSKWRPFIIIGSVVLILGVAAAVYLLRPDPCAGTNFSSQNFGYCLEVPDGWGAGPARFGSSVTLDQFAPPTSSATIVVEAVDLQSDATLQGWSDVVRQKVEGTGLTPGPTSERTIDGVDALQWDVTVEPQNGQAYEMRDIVAVRDHFGWRITLVDASQGFDTSSVVFQDMLDSWRFR